MGWEQGGERGWQEGELQQADDHIFSYLHKDTGP
jgi:hypothetical protein